MLTRRALLHCWLGVLVAATSATGAEVARAQSAEECARSFCGTAGTDTFTITGQGTRGISGSSPRSNKAAQAGGARSTGIAHAPLRTLVPTCAENDFTTTDQLCALATESCPEVDQMRFWVYEQTWNPTGQPPTYGPPSRGGTSVCVGPDAPDVAQQVDPRVLVAATVRRDWRTYGLPAGRVATRPTGQTLTGAVTQFSSPVEPQAVLHRTVLGLPVALTVTAQSYAWDFGDGTGTTQRAGQPPSAMHTYTRTAALAASLTITYTGSFTIGDDPQTYEVQGTATVPGPEQPLVVRQARTQLEHD